MAKGKRLRAHSEQRGNSIRVTIKLGRDVVDRPKGPQVGRRWKSIEEARKWCGDFNSVKDDEYEVQRVATSEAATIPIDLMLNEFEANHVQRCSEGHQRFARPRLNALREGFGSANLRTLTEIQVRDYCHLRFKTPPKNQPRGENPRPERKLTRNAKPKSGVGYGTVIGEINLLRNAVMRLVNDGSFAIQNNPLPNMMRIAKDVAKKEKVPEKPVEIYSDQEVFAVLTLMEEHRPHLYAPLRFMNACGARVGEILSLYENDINYSINRATVWEIKDGRPKQRALALPHEIMNWLEVHVKTMRAKFRWFSRKPICVFPSPTGLEWNSNDFGKALRRAGVHIEKAGLPAYTSHAFRHTYASRMLLKLKGEDLPWLADQLGHSIEVLLRRYAHVMPQERDLSFVDTMSQANQVDVRDLSAFAERAKASIAAGWGGRPRQS